jgi:hypothetical protein
VIVFGNAELHSDAFSVVTTSAKVNHGTSSLPIFSADAVYTVVIVMWLLLFVSTVANRVPPLFLFGYVSIIFTSHAVSTFPTAISFLQFHLLSPLDFLIEPATSELYPAMSISNARGYDEERYVSEIGVDASPKDVTSTEKPASGQEGSDISPATTPDSSQKILNKWQASLIYITNQVGVGILGLPSALQTLGLIPGLICIVGLGMLASAR